MRLRNVTVDDAAAIEAIYTPIVRETAISFEWEPPSLADWQQRVQKVTARYPWLVAVDDEQVVRGFAYANTHRDAPSYQWSVNTSVFVHADARGQGIGTALYRELHRQLVALGYFTAFAGIALPNAASVALHESVGYRPLGVYEKVGFKSGQWRDVGWWRKELQPCDREPTMPKKPGSIEPRGQQP